MDGSGSFVESVKTDFTPNAVVVTIYVVVGIFANMTVLFVYCTRMRQTMNRRYFIPYLAAVDLVSCLFNGVSGVIIKNIFFTFDDGNLCKFVRFLGTVLVLYSGFLLLIISIQRYLIICTKKPNIIDNKRQYLIFITLVPSLIIAGPRLIFPDATSVQLPNTNETLRMCAYSTVYQNSVELRVYKYFLMAILVIIVGIISVLYFFVMKTIITSERKLKKYKRSTDKNEIKTDVVIDFEASASNQEETEITDETNIEKAGSSKETKRRPAKSVRGSQKKVAAQKSFQHRLCLIFLSISVIGLVTYFPRLVIENMEAKNPLLFVDATSSQRVIYLLSSSLYISHCAIDPFIYGFCDNEFRRILKDMMTIRK